MSMRLNVGLSRKLGEPNYGSRGASVNLDLELDSALVAKPGKLQERIRQLFALVRTSLKEELNGNGNGQAVHHDPTPPPQAPSPQTPPPNSNGNGGSRNGSDRPATPAQIKAIYGISRQQAVNLDELLGNRYSVSRPNELTLRQASRLIDDLKKNETSSDR